MIPYTEDEWAKLKRPDGTTWYRDTLFGGNVTYALSTSEAPAAGTRLVFSVKDADFRTYSFEFKNEL